MSKQTRISANTTLGEALALPTGFYYSARGCFYDFEIYEDIPGEYGIVTYATNADGKALWDACATASADDRIIDVVRGCRECAAIARSDRR